MPNYQDPWVYSGGAQTNRSIAASQLNATFGYGNSSSQYVSNNGFFDPSRANSAYQGGNLAYSNFADKAYRNLQGGAYEQGAGLGSYNVGTNIWRLYNGPYTNSVYPQVYTNRQAHVRVYCQVSGYGGAGASGCGGAGGAGGNAVRYQGIAYGYGIVSSQGGYGLYGGGGGGGGGQNGNKQYQQAWGGQQSTGGGGGGGGAGYGGGGAGCGAQIGGGAGQGGSWPNGGAAGGTGGGNARSGGAGGNINAAGAAGASGAGGAAGGAYEGIYYGGLWT